MNKLFLYLLLIGQLLSHSIAQEATTQVLHLKVLSDIDPRTNRYVQLALDQAEASDVDYVILELDTYGGALNDADEIRTRILNFPKPIYSYINKDAASAGALISIACDSIYMAAGSSIGAATVVTQDGTAAPDKYQSYMRSIMRSTAEAQGRNPKIAEAMVDEDIDLDSIATEGKVLTFSVSEAIRWGYCEAQVEGIDEILLRSGVESYDISVFELDSTERVIQIFLNPYLSGILILIIIGGIYFELQTPGVGFPILASVVAAILYFIPHYLNGLAENWEIALFFVGLVLIGLEVFVIPGFGVAGVLGLIFTIGSFILVMINNDGFDFELVAPEKIFQATAITLAAVVGSVILLFVGGVRLAESKFFKRIALEETQDTTAGYTSTVYKSDLKGKTGTAYTILRPSGKVMIDDTLYDATTRGEYISKDDPIVVISTEGTSLKVKQG
ncbi:MAG: nodulation protein NfeD [Cyclobacteriaceae bacterium]